MKRCLIVLAVLAPVSCAHPAPKTAAVISATFSAPVPYSFWQTGGMSDETESMQLIQALQRTLPTWPGLHDVNQGSGDTCTLMVWFRIAWAERRNDPRSPLTYLVQFRKSSKHPPDSGELVGESHRQCSVDKIAQCAQRIAEDAVQAGRRIDCR